jgi:hypothetical protein
MYLQSGRDLTPQRPRATLPVTLQILPFYMEGTTLLGSCQLAAADRAADGPLVDAEPPCGLLRRQRLGHTTRAVRALPLPGLVPRLVGVVRRLVMHGSARMIEPSRPDKESEVVRRRRVVSRKS